ncbi:methyltransferase domain-containing protein [Thiohalocapsa marina]|uniref:methyltransferase domain-containing protein n=1 Tax=Thiohalocapsa marina TaxID=424902 RepID=UPI001FE3B408|nr:class I SAM-dependent methyltransferase [Thiohalocapsa marina]
MQCPEAEADFLHTEFQRLRGRAPRTLREDFCGTAAVCREWVRRDPNNHAVGIDLDPEVLDWARAEALARLAPEAGNRVRLQCADVRRCQTPGMDIVAAMNFSYWVFDQRPALRDYFRHVRAQLDADGVFFLDAYGGYDAFRELVEERTIDDAEGRFTYRWEQASYNPIDGAMQCHIHFELPDGTRLERAFSYRWRLWTLPELRELLTEAGFRCVTCYWQGWTADGEPDGQFHPAEQADADAGWICYLSAEP